MNLFFIKFNLIYILIYYQNKCMNRSDYSVEKTIREQMRISFGTTEGEVYHGIINTFRRDFSGRILEFMIKFERRAVEREKKQEKYVNNFKRNEIV